MVDFVEVRTADLLGEALDWAVAKAVSRDVSILSSGVVVRGDNVEGGCPWSPSTDWSQGGPLINKHDWALPYRATSRYHIGKYEACTPGGFPKNGETPLISACRAIVAAEYGDLVSVPAELWSAKP